ncbi:hypothetical protein [Candidatus Bodocaedibacter vickermanii]|uniref:Uncharacterized protein n=1 Tax=Candidatus Bodocaedibacter vickermanii TaxID=2741701 RepID=A0A7L9RTH6_9PROT|nr:hypothetical protein CPBP_00601 [Candidatus Paracaedibacteraceae bacterium 'Lake Konstanz']
MDYATLYISDPSIIGSKVLDTMPEILSYNSKSDNHHVLGMTLRLKAANIDCNFMVNSELENHLNGLSNFVSGSIAEGVDLSYSLSRVSQVRMAMGCCIDPGFDSEGEILNFIKHYSRTLNSLLFYDSTLFDYDLQILATLK